MILNHNFSIAVIFSLLIFYSTVHLWLHNPKNLSGLFYCMGGVSTVLYFLSCSLVSESITVATLAMQVRRLSIIFIFMGFLGLSMTYPEGKLSPGNKRLFIILGIWGAFVVAPGLIPGLQHLYFKEIHLYPWKTSLQEDWRQTFNQIPYFCWEFAVLISLVVIIVLKLRAHNNRRASLFFLAPLFMGLFMGAIFYGVFPTYFEHEGAAGFGTIGVFTAFLSMVYAMLNFGSFKNSFMAKLNILALFIVSLILLFNFNLNYGGIMQHLGQDRVQLAKNIRVVAENIGASEDLQLKASLLASLAEKEGSLSHWAVLNRNNVLYRSPGFPQTLFDHTAEVIKKGSVWGFIPIKVFRPYDILNVRLDQSGLNQLKLFLPSLSLNPEVQGMYLNHVVTSMAAFVIILIVVPLTTWFGIAQPMRKLDLMAREIARERYGHRVEVHSRDEFENLADALNHMADMIQKSLVCIQRQNEELEIKIRSRTAQLDGAYRHMEKLAMTDPLTGMANRRCFFKRLEQEVIRHKRNGRPLSILMADLDFFKKINDKWGHEQGDDVLLEFSVLLADRIRRSDLCGRIGGEEFAVILPETDLEGALKVGEDILKAVRKHLFKRKDGQGYLTITVSIGGATINGDIRTSLDLFREADQAMYLAKEAGRDRIMSKSPPVKKQMHP